VVAAVQHELLARGAIEALVTTCGCLGPCFDGPNAVVYPDGVWYGALEPADAVALADHLIDGRALAAKVSQRPGPSADVTSDTTGEPAADAVNAAHRGRTGNDGQP
jgi:(2Fe-2S) ferredoxin